MIAPRVPCPESKFASKAVNKSRFLYFRARTEECGRVWCYGIKLELFGRLFEWNTLGY